MDVPSVSPIRAQTAEYIGIQGPALTKIERGQQRCSTAYLKLLLQLYGVGSPHSDALERLLREANERGWWAVYGDTVPEWFQQYVGMESAADEIWSYESELVPGLLQTPGYVRAIARGTRPDSTEEDLRRSVEFRQARQGRLDGNQAIRLHVILNEAVLLRQVGGAGVLRDQLNYLLAAAQFPNVTIQVMPFTSGAHAAMKGSFTMLRFPDDMQMNTVYVEMEGAAAYRERPRELDRHKVIFTQLRDTALDAQMSSALITELVKQL
jgi:hypothetical protein